MHRGAPSIAWSAAGAVRTHCRPVQYEFQGPEGAGMRV